MSFKPLAYTHDEVNSHAYILITNALHCAITGLYLSSICNKVALLIHENNKFDRKEKLRTIRLTRKRN